MKKKSLLLTAVATLGLTAATMAQNVPSYVPTNGLVGWWPFNGNANDESGNGNNGINFGVSLFNDRFGNSNHAYYFNGINSYISIVDNPSLDFVNYSLSFWLLKDPNSNMNQSYIINKGCYPNLSFRFYFNGISITDVYTPNVGFVSGPTASNFWDHYLVTYNGVQLKMYLNGTLINNTIQSGNISSSNNNLMFGARIDGANCTVDSYFNGALDDIAIWNRALTQQEINDLYNGPNAEISTINDADLIKVFPNPTNDHITIDYGNFGMMNGYKLIVENSVGQQIFQTNISQQSDNLSLTNWTGNGVYFIHIIDSTGNTIAIRKIVLQ